MVVQSKTGTVASGTSMMVTLNSNVASGNLILVITGRTASGTPNVTDNQSNAYTFQNREFGVTTGELDYFWAPASASGALTVTITWSGSAAVDVIVAEYAKSGTPNWDVEAKSNTNTSTSLSTGNATTTVASDVLTVFGYDTTQAGTPFSDSQSFTQVTSTSKIVLFEKQVSVTGTYSDTITFGGAVSGNNLMAFIAAFSGVVASNVLSASCGNPPTAYKNSVYTHTFGASGGTAPYTFSISAGSLPPGLTLNSSTGVVSGTPTSSGTFNFTLLVTDSVLATSSVACSILVQPASAAPFLSLVPTQITTLQAMFDNTKSVDILQMTNIGNTLLYFSKQQYPFLSANELATSYGSDITGKIWSSISNIATGINSPGGGTSSGMGLAYSGTKVYLSDAKLPIDGVSGLNHTLGIWTYDSIAKLWSGPGANGPFVADSSSGATAVVALNNGKLLVVFNQKNDAFVTNSALLSVIYDPVANTWGSTTILANYGNVAGNLLATPLAIVHDPVSDNTVLFFIPGSTNSTANLNLEAMVLSNTGALLNTPSSIFLFTTIVPVNGHMGVSCVTSDSPSTHPSAGFPFLDQSGQIRMAWVDFSTFAQSLETAAFPTDFEPPNSTITAYTQQNQGAWAAFDFNGFCYLFFAVDNGTLNSASSQCFYYAKSRGGSTTWSGLQLLFTSVLSREPLQPFKAAWTAQGPAILLNLWDPTNNPQSGTIAGLTTWILLPTGNSPPPPPPTQIRTLRFEIPKKRWFPHSYGDTIVTHYLDELYGGSVDNQQLLLLSSALGFIYKAGGDTDNGTAITSIVTTPSMDGGDDRVQKLYVDIMTDMDGAGTLTAFSQFNNQTVNGPNVPYTTSGSRNQQLQNISSISNLNLYRNVAITYQWTGGPDGPRLYVSEPAGYVQPYISTFFVTQFINLAFPGWKHHRRLYAGYISNSTILFTIKTQDGRTYGPYSLPSTNGQFQIIQQMLDQDIKDLAFAYQIDGQGLNFALFPEAWTIETKEWTQPSYIPLAVFKT